MAATILSETVDMALECGAFHALIGGLPAIPKTETPAVRGEMADARQQVEELLAADGWTPTSDEDEWVKGDRLASVCVRSRTAESIYGVVVYVRVGRQLLNRPLAAWDFAADGTATLKAGVV